VDCGLWTVHGAGSARPSESDTTPSTTSLDNNTPVVYRCKYRCKNIQHVAHAHTHTPVTKLSKLFSTLVVSTAYKPIYTHILDSRKDPTDPQYQTLAWTRPVTNPMTMYFD